MVVYIAGPMKGLPDLGRMKFKEAAEKLRRDGHIVLNPGELPIGIPGDRYMPLCLAMVDAADAVYAFSNWRESLGAQIEVKYARYQGKMVLLEE